MLTMRRLGTVACAWFFVAGNAAGAADPPLAPESHLGPYVYHATLMRTAGEVEREFGAIVAIAGDTVLVGGAGAVYVFDRTPATDVWREAAPIVPPGPVEAFGRALAYDGHTVIVGAEGAAYLFRRTGPDTWHQGAILTIPAPDTSFGRSVGISGERAIVGGSFFNGAYIFRRHDGPVETWPQAAVLVDVVGQYVGLNSDTAIVVTPISLEGGVARFFRREGNADDRWTLVREDDGLHRPFSVALSETTAVIGGGEVNPHANVFGRDVGGVNAWAQQAFFTALECNSDGCIKRQPEFGAATGVSTSGNAIVLGAGGLGRGAAILSRHQDGRDAWGIVSWFLPASSPPLIDLGNTGVAIDGDTVAIGSVGRTGGGPGVANAVYLFVSDVDGDGMRDGIDPCPRDPRNNVGGKCQRDSGASPVLDDLVTLDAVDVESAGQPFVITATFTNSSDTAIRNPFFDVTELTAGNALANADAGPGGIGASLSPDVGDGLLSPGESMTVTFAINLGTTEPFAFWVSLRGETVP